MSSFTDKYNLNKPNLDGENDLTPEVKTSYMIGKEAATKVEEKKEEESSEESE